MSNQEKTFTFKDVNILHSFNDEPAKIIIDRDENGKVIKVLKEWYHENRLHRDKKPAQEIYTVDDNGFEHYDYCHYRKGILHNISGPCIVISGKNENGDYKDTDNYFINNVRYEKDNFERIIDVMKRYVRRLSFLVDQPGTNTFEIRAEQEYQRLIDLV